MKYMGPAEGVCGGAESDERSASTLNRLRDASEGFHRLRERGQNHGSGCDECKANAIREVDRFLRVSPKDLSLVSHALSSV
jgi:hypothetical protein